MSKGLYQLQSEGDYDTLLERTADLKDDEATFYHSYALFRKGELEKAMDGINRKADSTFWDVMFKMLKGKILTHRGKIENAERYFNHALHYLAEHKPQTTFHGDALNNIGNLLMYQGDLEGAESYFKNALEIFDHLEDQHKIGIMFGNLGLVHKHLARYDEAIADFQQAISLLEKIGNTLPLANFCLHMVETLTTVDQIREAEQYMENIEQIRIQSNNQRIDVFYKYSKALIYTKEESFLSLGKASQLFNQVIKGSDFRADLRKNSIGHLLNILVLEYQLFGKQETYNRIRELVDELHKISLEQNLFPSLINAIILQSKLSLVDGDYEEAKRLVSIANEIALENNLMEMYEITKKEEEKIEYNLIQMQRLVSRNSDLLSRLDQIDFISYLKNVIPSTFREFQKMKHDEKS